MQAALGQTVSEQNNLPTQVLLKSLETACVSFLYQCVNVHGRCYGAGQPGLGYMTLLDVDLSAGPMTS